MGRRLILLGFICCVISSCAKARYTYDQNAKYSHQIAIPESNLDAELPPPVGPILGESGWVKIDGQNYYIVRWLELKGENNDPK